MIKIKLILYVIKCEKLYLKQTEKILIQYNNEQSHKSGDGFLKT